jgi:hypothetical protein
VAVVDWVVLEQLLLAVLAVLFWLLEQMVLLEHH